MRFLFGPVPALITVRTTLNFSAVAFLSFLGLVAFSPASVSDFEFNPSKSWSVFPASLLVLAVFAAFAPSLNAPFVFDDYVHLTNASTATLPTVFRRTLVQHPIGGDLFFRPIGSLYYWLVFRLAGFNPFVWHLGSVVIHLVNTLLVFRIGKRLSAGLLPAFIAALLFGWHGSHVEAVSWLAAAFDLLATFFVLLASLLALSHRSIFAIAHCSALACLSKESAYCLPLLIACTALFFQGSERTRLLKQAVPVALTCASAFLYRLWYLQGFGGYRSAGGHSVAAAIHPLALFQALLLRVWAVLFIPFNWSEKPGALTKVAASLLLLLVCVLAIRRKWSPHPTIYPALLFVLCASLPVFPLLLISPDLSGARVLYLPSVGISLLWLRVIQRTELKSAAALSFSLLIFQLAALQHNQHIWTEVANTARQACFDAAQILKQDPRSSIVAYNLPKTRKGVFFLQNGFPQCVSINGAVDAARITVSDATPLQLSQYQRPFDANTAVK